MWKHVQKRQKSGGHHEAFYEALLPTPPACSAWGQGGLYDDPPPVMNRERTDRSSCLNVKIEQLHTVHGAHMEVDSLSSRRPKVKLIPHRSCF